MPSTERWARIRDQAARRDRHRSMQERQEIAGRIRERVDRNIAEVAVPNPFMDLVRNLTLTGNALVEFQNEMRNIRISLTTQEPPVPNEQPVQPPGNWARSNTVNITWDGAGAFTFGPPNYLVVGDPADVVNARTLPPLPVNPPIEWAPVPIPARCPCGEPGHPAWEHSPDGCTYRERPVSEYDDEPNEPEDDDD